MNCVPDISANIILQHSSTNNIVRYTVNCINCGEKYDSMYFLNDSQIKGILENTDKPLHTICKCCGKITTMIKEFLGRSNIDRCTETCEKCGSRYDVMYFLNDEQKNIMKENDLTIYKNTLCVNCGEKIDEY